MAKMSTAEPLETRGQAAAFEARDVATLIALIGCKAETEGMQRAAGPMSSSADIGERRPEMKAHRARHGVAASTLSSASRRRRLCARAPHHRSVARGNRSRAVDFAASIVPASGEEIVAIIGPAGNGAGDLA